MVIERLKTGIAIVLGFYQIYFMENILKFTNNIRNKYKIDKQEYLIGEIPIVTEKELKKQK